MPLIFVIAAGLLGLFLVDRVSTPQAMEHAAPDGDADPPATVSDTVASVGNEAKAGLMKIFGTPYDDLIKSSAGAAGIDPDILWRLLFAESHFREDIISGRVTSSAGAQGIAQFMPDTAASLRIDPLDPEQAIPGAAKYLATLIQQAGSVASGVAAYNWGIGNVQRKGLAKAPSETVRYVALITGEDISGVRA